MKRVLSLVLVLTLVLGMIPVSFADGETSGNWLKENGLVEGYADGTLGENDPLTRAQMMVLLAQMYNVFEDAKSFTLPTSFTDVPADAWYAPYVAYAQNVGQWTAGYAEADGTYTFRPDAPVSDKELATFMLKALGHEVKDFNNAVAEAKEVGFEVSTGTALKRGDAFVAMETVVKEVPKKGEEAPLGVELGIIETTPEVVVETVKPDSVEARTHAMIDVTIAEDDALTTAPAADKFEIKDEDGNALEVKGVELRDSGETVRLTTAKMAVGALYTITVDGSTEEFVGLPEDKTELAVDDALAETNTTVKVTFDNDDFDEASATNVDNYEIDNDLEVLSAKIDGSDVVLTTSAQKSGKLYTITVKNIADLAGNVMEDDAEDRFGGRPADTTEPTIKQILAEEGLTLKVTWTEAEMLDEATALDISNYSVDKDLEILSAKFEEDTNDNGEDPVVILTTSEQKQGTLYTLTVENVKDAAGNEMDKEEERFGGSPLDTDELVLENAYAKTNTMVVVNFDDKVDADLAVVVDNYEIDNDLEVLAAEVDSDDETIVNLTTSAQKSGQLYKITVKNLKDNAGNGVDSDNDNDKFGGKAADKDEPEIDSVVSVDQNTVRVTFNEEVDEATAERLSNYKFDNDLGYPTKAVLKKDEDNNDEMRIVELSTADQAAKVYTLTVNNVKDLSDNVIEEDTEATFSGIGGALDKLEVVGAVTLNKQQVKVIFNQAIDAAETTDYEITGEDKDENLHGKTAASAYLTDDDTAVVLTFKADGVEMESGDVYTITVKDSDGVYLVTGEYGAKLNSDKDDAKFAGTTDAMADIEPAAVEVVDKKTIKVTFTEDLKSTGVVATAFALFLDEGDIAKESNDGADLTFATATIVDDNAVKLVLGTDKELEESKVYHLNIREDHNITNMGGVDKLKIDEAADAAEMPFATGSISDIKLKVDGAIMNDENTVTVYFTHDIDVEDFNLATDVAITDGDKDIVAKGGFSYYIADDNMLTLYFETSADYNSGDVWDVEFFNETIAYVNDTTVKLDKDNDTEEVAAVTTDNAAPKISSVAVVADDKIKVTLSEGLNGLTMSDSTTQVDDPDSDDAADTVDEAETLDDIVIHNTATDERVTAAALTLMKGYDAGDKVSKADTSFVVVLDGYTFESGVTYEVYFAAGSDLKDQMSIQAVKKDDADTSKHENAVKFSGTAE